MIIGSFLVLISILILFIVPFILDRIGDSLMVLILALLIVGFPFACFGSILVASSYPAIGNAGRDYGLIIIGSLISIFGAMAWVFFLVSALYDLYILAILNYYSIPMSILAGLFGGWVIGVGLPGKRRVEIDEQG